MGGDDFTFLNETGERIFVVHKHKIIDGTPVPLENGESKTIQVNIPPETHEKYWLYSSTDNATGIFVNSDEYENSKQVTVVKEGDKFVPNFLARPKNRLEEWTMKLKSSLSWPKNRESGTLPVTRPSTSGGPNR